MCLLKELVYQWFEDLNNYEIGSVKQLQADGFPLLNGPRTTGDGYYEAVIQDPEGNLIELMAG